MFVLCVLSIDNNTVYGEFQITSNYKAL